ncbi:5092_t:CDS:1, partial [Paraglomus occultum]
PLTVESQSRYFSHLPTVLVWIFVYIVRQAQHAKTEEWQGTPPALGHLLEDLQCPVSSSRPLKFFVALDSSWSLICIEKGRAKISKCCPTLSTGQRMNTSPNKSTHSQIRNRKKAAAA